MMNNDAILIDSIAKAKILTSAKKHLETFGKEPNYIGIN